MSQKRVTKKSRKYLVLSENEDTTYKNLWDIIKTGQKKKNSQKSIFKLLWTHLTYSKHKK